MHCDGEDKYFKINNRENSVTGVEQLQPRMEGKSYNSVSKKLQFLMNNDVCMKKKIQEMMKESEVTNNTNTHAYMQESVNVMLT